MPAEPCALVLRRIPGTHTDGRIPGRNARLLRHSGDARQRCAQIAFNIGGQCLQRRDVDHAAAAFRRALTRTQHQPVQAPKKRGQCLAGAGWRQDQRRLAARNGGPAFALRSGRRAQSGAKPRRGNRMGRGANARSRRAVARARSSGLARQSLLASARSSVWRSLAASRRMATSSIPARPSSLRASAPDRRALRRASAGVRQRLQPGKAQEAGRSRNGVDGTEDLRQQLAVARPRSSSVRQAPSAPVPPRSRR